MRQEGHTIEGPPEGVEDLQESILEDPGQTCGVADLSVKGRASVSEYQEFPPLATNLGENWGNPSGS